MKESNPFAFDFIERNNDVFLVIHVESIPVKITELNSPSTMMVPERCLVIEVRTKKEGSKVILVSGDAREIPVSDNFNIVFAVPKISISFVNESLRELVLLTFHQFDLIYSCVSNVNTVFFSILSFQLDDIYPDVPLPVALFSIPKQYSAYFSG